MRVSLFEKSISYSSVISPSEIEESLRHLLKITEGDNVFVGKVGSGSFEIAPKPSPGGHFRIVLKGTLENTGLTKVHITYTISDNFKLVLYGLPLFYLVLAIVLNLSGVPTRFMEVQHPELYLLGGSVLFVLNAKFQYTIQVWEYSGFIERYLGLKNEN